MVFLIRQIGELARGLSDEFKQSTLDAVPWVQIRSVCNRIVHHYGSVDYAVIWDIVENYIAPLKDFCEEQLDDRSHKDSSRA